MTKDPGANNWLPFIFSAFLSLTALIGSIATSVIFRFTLEHSWATMLTTFVASLPGCFLFVGYVTSKLQREIRNLQRQVTQLQDAHPEIAVERSAIAQVPVETLKFQFSLQWLMIAVAIIALNIACWVKTTEVLKEIASQRTLAAPAAVPIPTRTLPPPMPPAKKMPSGRE